MFEASKKDLICDAVIAGTTVLGVLLYGYLFYLAGKGSHVNLFFWLASGLFSMCALGSLILVIKSVVFFFKSKPLNAILSIILLGVIFVFVSHDNNTQSVAVSKGFLETIKKNTTTADLLEWAKTVASKQSSNGAFVKVEDTDVPEFVKKLWGEKPPRCGIASLRGCKYVILDWGRWGLKISLDGLLFQSDISTYHNHWADGIFVFYNMG